MFSMRIVNVDHYMSPPKSGLDITYSQFRGNQVKSVPVIRIFGSTPSGCKACLHVHGVFPYVLVPYSGAEEAGRVMYQLASSLDKAINVSLGTSYSNKQYVFKIVQVSGRPFYGYHGQDHQFLKVFFYNPAITKRASELLQNGAICGTHFQIHESHVPFILQFFIDYNLYGMSFINLKSVVYRKDANPPGTISGTSIRESFCELEADGVAVDILNRLTVEGELAVNPGLAAIWKEEKKRLQGCALELSQRPISKKTMSEILLQEKLKENLKFQGKCKSSSLKETIPYPAETQRTSTSEIVDASVLDTHSVSSLLPAATVGDNEVTVVDEELVLSLSQKSDTLKSFDQSLLAALDTLGAPSENINLVINQYVEDDSILGSQMLSDENGCEDDCAVLEYSLPVDLPSDDLASKQNDEESDESFDENIPQLDGIGDVFRRKKKKPKRRKSTTILDNSATESNVFFEDDETLMNSLKDSNIWPESGKQECLDEIFSDDEPFNSPIHNFEEDGIVPSEPITIDVLSSYDTVLKGDPSFMCRDLMFSEDLLLQSKNDTVVWDSLPEACEKIIVQDCALKTLPNSEISTVTLDEKDPNIDKNRTTSASTLTLINNNLEADLEKPLSLLSCSEDLLSTAQLDEIFNEDLNKGLEIIYENNSQHENEGSSTQTSDISKRCNSNEHLMNLIKKENGTITNKPVIASDVPSNEVKFSDDTTNDEFFHLPNTSKENKSKMDFNFISEMFTKEEDEKHTKNKAQDCVESHNLLNDVCIATSFKVGNCTRLTEKNCQTSDQPSGNTNGDVKSSCKETTQNRTSCDRVYSRSNQNTLDKVEKKQTINSLKQRSPSKHKCLKFKKGVNKLHISCDIFQKKTIKSTLTHYNPYKMSDDEIKRYFAQLEFIASSLKNRGTSRVEEPMLWNPIRNIVKRKQRKSKKFLKIMKQNNFSIQDISKLTSCSVRLKRLSYNDIKLVCKKNMLQIKIDLFTKKQLLSKKKNQRRQLTQKADPCKTNKKLRTCKNNAIKNSCSKNASESNVSHMNKLTFTSGNNVEMPLLLPSTSKNNSSISLCNRSVENCSLQSQRLKNSECKPKGHTNLGKSDPIVLISRKVRDVQLSSLKPISQNLAIENGSYLDKKAIANDSRTLNESKVFVASPPCSEINSLVNNNKDEILVITPRSHEKLSPVVILQDDKNKLRTKCKSKSVEEFSKNKHQRVKKVCSKNENIHFDPIGLKVDQILTDKSDEAILSSQLDYFKSLECASKNNVLCKSVKYPKTVKKEQLRKTHTSYETCREAGMKRMRSFKVKPMIINSNCELSSSTNSDICTNHIPVVCLGGDNILLNNFTDSTAVQKENLDHNRADSESPLLRISENMNPLVQVDKLNSVSYLNKSIDNKHNNLGNSPFNLLGANIKVKRKRSSSLDLIKIPLNKLCNDTNVKKRSLRIYSLDGTADNSSSDENVDDRNCKDKGVDSTLQCETPVKRRVSTKINRTPKANYVPLNITVKKSPQARVELKDKNEHIFANEQAGEFNLLNTRVRVEAPQLKSQPKENFVGGVTNDTPKVLTPTDNKKKLEPFIKVKRLSSSSISTTSIGQIDNVKAPSISASSNFVDKYECNLLESRTCVKTAVLESEFENDSSNNATNEKEKFQPIKRQRLEPIIKVERISSTTTSTTPNGQEDNIETLSCVINNDLKPTVFHPVVRSLKVSVRRLSSDAQENPADNETLARLKRRLHRCSSLPTAPK